MSFFFLASCVTGNKRGDNFCEMVNAASMITPAWQRTRCQVQPPGEGEVIAKSLRVHGRHLKSCKSWGFCRSCNIVWRSSKQISRNAVALCCALSKLFFFSLRFLLPFFLVSLLPTFIFLSCSLAFSLYFLAYFIPSFLSPSYTPSSYLSPLLTLSPSLPLHLPRPSFPPLSLYSPPSFTV